MINKELTSKTISSHPTIKEKKAPPSSEEIQNWLISYTADLLEMDSEEINPATPFASYGLDSSAMVVLSGDLQTWLEIELDPTLLYDYPTIEALAEYLVEKLSAAA
jgi:acyl carrier protein